MTANYLLLTNCLCQSSSVSGYVRDNITGKSLKNASVSLFTKTGEGTLLAATINTDTTGRFVFKNLMAGWYSLSCFYKMPSGNSHLPKEIANNFGRYEVDSNITITPGQTYTHIFCLLVTCPFDKTKDQRDCPVCKKTDKVQPIIWGLPTYNVDGEIVTNGNKVNLDDYYLGGCSPDNWCNPTRHCTRCNVDF